MSLHKVIFSANTFTDEKISALKEKGIEIIKQPHNLSENDLIKALEGVEGYILGGDEIKVQICRVSMQICRGFRLKRVNIL